MHSKKRSILKKKRIIIPLIILLLLIGARLYLPIWAKGYINKVLADIPGYYGQVDDIDISLYRGAYTINGMYLNKVDAETQIPFLNFPETDISVEWNALFNGAIVAEITMNSPEVIYVLEDQKTTSNEEAASVDDWTNALKDIVPLEINHFEVYNGKIALVGLMAEPNIDLQINELNLSAKNLRNVIERQRVLPSPINATGVSFGGGNVKLDGNMNLFQEIPDMDISLSLEKSEAKALNDLTSYYAGLDFESGTFELFSEIAIADGYLKGYLKPMLTNTTMIGKEDGFLETLWEGFTSFFKFILKNKGTDTIATEVPIEGDLNNPQAGVWPTIGGIFKNGWFKAFKGETDESIEYKDAFQDAKESRKGLTKEQKENLSSEEKKRLRKELREERKKDTTDGFFKRLFGGDDDTK
ncbi:DUF748 domain-containing protein [Christiangramia forsetii]|uniref:DUF748 domain-containing protein n=1 Tax=Christiangramia forsetii (strain DSM 17595 / CGMCC 1.15422 / KT0803) TaxID=411154 RepID=A0LXE1_CHRFK|nr:DUF748 domain-containing protein [Christiangramia forsetii]CAL65036.1 conserved hypothetical protein, secreted [Christiangramia forsetii KT0803]